MYINVNLQPMERRLIARRQVCWLDAGVAVQNVERSRTSFYMSKVSGSCQRLAVHVKGYRDVPAPN